MTTPNQNELTFYTNKPLDDQDWRTNWLQVISWLTGGTYDFTVNDLTVSGDQTIAGALTVTGTVTANAFSGDGSALTNVNRINTNFIRNGDARVWDRGVAYTLVKDAYATSGGNWDGMATGTLVSAGTFTQLTTGANVGRSGYAFKFSGVTLTGTGILYFRQRILSKDAVQFINQVASFSVQAYHDVGSAVNYTVYLRKADAKDDFSAVTEISNSGAISVEDSTATEVSFENVSMGNCANGVEVEIKVEAGAITTKNFEFSEAQLELSATATDYERLPVNRRKMELVYSTQLTAEATSHTIDYPFNGDEDMEYEVVCRVVAGGDAATATSEFGLQFNGDSTNEYTYQATLFQNTTVQGSQSTGSAYAPIGATFYSGAVLYGLAYSRAHIYARSGQYRQVLADCGIHRGDNNAVWGRYGWASSWLDTSANLTSMVLIAGQTNGLGVGTIIELWKRR